MVRVRSAEALEGFKLRLLLTDGSERTVDVSDLLRGPVFEALRADRSLFKLAPACYSGLRSDFLLRDIDTGMGSYRRLQRTRPTSCGPHRCGVCAYVRATCMT